jgi:microcystin-dependent protein
MSEPFIAEIRIFAGNFAPRNWAFCNGQLLPIAQNTALFSLVGTTYGGDGRTTFGLPNLQGRAPMHPGNGPGLTARRLGQMGGNEDVTATVAQMPAHNHQVQAVNEPGNDNQAGGGIPARTVGFAAYTSSPGNFVAMAGNSVQNKGDGQAHNNMQPFLALNFIIALVGLYPSRS